MTFDLVKPENPSEGLSPKSNQDLDNLIEIDDKTTRYSHTSIILTPNLLELRPFLELSIRLSAKYGTYNRKELIGFEELIKFLPVVEGYEYDYRGKVYYSAEAFLIDAKTNYLMYLDDHITSFSNIAIYIRGVYIKTIYGGYNRHAKPSKNQVETVIINIEDPSILPNISRSDIQQKDITDIMYSLEAAFYRHILNDSRLNKGQKNLLKKFGKLRYMEKGTLET